MTMEVAISKEQLRYFALIRREEPYRKLTLAQYARALVENEVPDGENIVPCVSGLRFREGEGIGEDNEIIDLEGADLSGSKWINCDLNAKFIRFTGEYADRRGSVRRLKNSTNLQGVVFEGGTKFVGHDLSGVQFGPVDFGEGALFENCWLRHAIMDPTGSKLVTVKATKEQLQAYIKLRTETEIPGAAQGSFSDYLQATMGYRFPKGSEIIADLRHLRTIDATELEIPANVELDFSRSDLRGMKFENFNHRIILRDCDLYRAKFNNCYFAAGSDFRGSELGRVRIVGGTTFNAPKMSITGGEDLEDSVNRAKRVHLLPESFSMRSFASGGASIEFDPCYRRGSLQEDLETPTIYRRPPNGLEDVYDYRDHCHSREAIRRAKQAYRDKHNGDEPSYDRDWVQELPSFAKFLHDKYKFAHLVIRISDDNFVPDLQGLDFVNEGRTLARFEDPYNETHGFSNLSNLNFGRCNFGRSIISGIRFDGCNFEDSNFSAAELQPETRLMPRIAWNRWIPYPSWGDDQPTSFRGANLANTCFRAAYADRTVFTEATVTNMHAVDSAMMSVQAERIEGEYANFTRSYWYGGTIERANLPYANFSHTNFHHASVDPIPIWLNCSRAMGATLEGASFRYATVDGVNFNEANLDRTDFVGAAARHAKFREAKMRNARMTGFRYGAEMEGANVEKMLIDEVLFALSEEAEILEGLGEPDPERTRGWEARWAGCNVSKALPNAGREGAIYAKMRQEKSNVISRPLIRFMHGLARLADLAGIGGLRDSLYRGAEIVEEGLTNPWLYFTSTLIVGAVAFTAASVISFQILPAVTAPTAFLGLSIAAGVATVVGAPKLAKNEYLQKFFGYTGYEVDKAREVFKGRAQEIYNNIQLQAKLHKQFEKIPSLKISDTQRVRLERAMAIIPGARRERGSGQLRGVVGQGVTHAGREERRRAASPADSRRQKPSTHTEREAQRVVGASRERKP